MRFGGGHPRVFEYALFHTHLRLYAEEGSIRIPDCGAPARACRIWDGRLEPPVCEADREPSVFPGPFAATNRSFDSRRKLAQNRDFPSSRNSGSAVEAPMLGAVGPWTSLSEKLPTLLCTGEIESQTIVSSFF